MTFDPTAIDPIVASRLSEKQKAILSNPKLESVLEQVKQDIADSLYFHANDLNQTLYNHCWQMHKEKATDQEEEKKEAPKKKAKDEKGGILSSL